MRDFESDLKAFKEALLRAYNTGYKDGAERAKRQVLAAISGEPPVVTEQQEMPTVADEVKINKPKRKRAPRGLPRALTVRVMSAHPSGVTPQQIVESAETEFEKMIAVSSVRSELRKGEEEERYVEVDGVWHLADSDEAEGKTFQERPSASNSSHERIQDAPSVTRRMPGTN
ncbi:hypothetical protein ACFMPD_13565 [Sedimentitalea sp. HM32M-2]|uniref:hypothetical protein n=1 Tax=Sedimentitalea sp. HM32M-2 TaxID=3351566 RepID=UPI003631B11B